MKKLTPEDRRRIKENFLTKNRFGIWLKRNHEQIQGFLSIITLAGFIILTVGTFIPTSFSIIIPIINQYPLSLFFGTSIHGYTTYPKPQSNLYGDIAFSYVATHHLTDIMCMWIGYFIMVVKTKSFIWPGLYSGYVIAIHEWFWWIGYDIYFFDFIFQGGHLNQSYLSKLSIPYSIIIFTYIILKGFDKKDARYLLLIGIMYFFWIFILGFPVTWGFNGPSQYLYNIAVISIEMASWIYAYIIFISTVDYNKIKYRLVK